MDDFGNCLCCYRRQYGEEPESKVCGWCDPAPVVHTSDDAADGTLIGVTDDYGDLIA